MADDRSIEWEAPGPGVWAHDPAHFPTPLTGFSRRTSTPGSAEGFRDGYARYGHPTSRNERAVVNGWAFGQRVPVDEGLYAEREQAAREAIDQRLWRIDGERWFTVERPKIIEDCLAFQAVDPGSLDEAELAQHLLDGLELQRRAHYHHFSHVPMVFVVGEWLLAATEWGIPPEVAYALLAGASPATAAAARDLARVADALAEVGMTEVVSLEQLRASPTASAALDDYVAMYGWRTIGGFDLDAKALIEMPELLLASIRNALERPFEPQDVDVDPIRNQVPETDREKFDDLLTEARYVYGLRDDDVAPCMWTRGLIRRALLEVADRLLVGGRLRERDDVLEAGAEELVELLRGASEPDAAELASRAALRREQALLTPPATIGVPAPPQGALPPTVARVARGLAAYMGRPGQPTASAGDVVGTGVGTRPVRGRACVALRVEDAVARLQPGDVLVTRITTPAFNSILPMVAGLVVEHGGPTSHSGIMARELGLPAVLDARGCMASIPDGAEIEVDPTTGVVHVLSL